MSADETTPERKTKRRRLDDDQGIPKQAFRNLVHQIAHDIKSDLRFQSEAMDALQAAAENLLTDRFRRCSELALLCKMDTVRTDHWRFVARALSPCSDKS